MWYNPAMDDAILTVTFFLTESGREPVREWLKELNREDRKTLATDLQLARKRKNLWLSEVSEKQ
jgi:hypothetical protein